MYIYLYLYNNYALLEFADVIVSTDVKGGGQESEKAVSIFIYLDYIYIYIYIYTYIYTYIYLYIYIAILRFSHSRITFFQPTSPGMGKRAKSGKKRSNCIFMYSFIYFEYLYLYLSMYLSINLSIYLYLYNNSALLAFAERYRFNGRHRWWARKWKGCAKRLIYLCVLFLSCCCVCDLFLLLHAYQISISIYLSIDLSIHLSLYISISTTIRCCWHLRALYFQPTSRGMGKKVKRRYKKMNIHLFLLSVSIDLNRYIYL